MPLYEYKCLECKRHTEKIQKFSDPEITVCPKCGGTLERVITAPAIAFKGGGWYADGYGNAKPAASETKGESKTDGAPAASETKTESKPSGGSETTAAPAASTPAPASAPAAAATSPTK